MHVPPPHSAASGPPSVAAAGYGALPGSAELTRRLAEVLGRGLEPQRSVAVLCLDLRVQSQGRGRPLAELPEALLPEIAARLQAILQPRDLLCRSGGSEFALLLPALASPGIAHLAAQAILDALRAPLHGTTTALAVLPAIGVALAPQHARSPEALLVCARLAARECARRAALAGGGQRLGFLVYDGDPLPERKEAAVSAGELQSAIEDSALCLHYQPQLDLRSGRVQSVEALLRWQRGPGDWIRPEAVLACAEQANLTGVLTQWTINTALRQAAQWQREGLPPVEMGVNLPPAALQQTDFPALIGLGLQTFGVAAHQLTLEITESAAIADAGCSLRTLSELRALGVRISVDDFGTGYNSYQWLRDMPLDEVKIEKLFIRDLRTSTRNTIIVDSLIRLAHALGVSVVAEGVEDQATHHALARLECDRIQGYGFSRPVPAEACAEFLARRAEAAHPEAALGVLQTAMLRLD